jgi:hypothetical protein
MRGRRRPTRQRRPRPVAEEPEDCFADRELSGVLSAGRKFEGQRRLPRAVCGSQDHEFRGRDVQLQVRRRDPIEHLMCPHQFPFSMDKLHDCRKAKINS